MPLRAINDEILPNGGLLPTQPGDFEQVQNACHRPCCVPPPSLPKSRSTSKLDSIAASPIGSFDASKTTLPSRTVLRTLVAPIFVGSIVEKVFDRARPYPRTCRLQYCRSWHPGLSGRLSRACRLRPRWRHRSPDRAQVVRHVHPAPGASQRPPGRQADRARRWGHRRRARCVYPRPPPT